MLCHHLHRLKVRQESLHVLTSVNFALQPVPVIVVVRRIAMKIIVMVMGHVGMAIILMIKAASTCNPAMTTEFYSGTSFVDGRVL